MTILLFGQLAEAVGTHRLQIAPQPDTEALISHIRQTYPSLKEHTFNVAVDKDIIHSSTTLTADAEIALLPPYSGG